MYFSDILLAEFEGRIEVAILSPDDAMDRAKLENLDIKPLGGWKRGCGSEFLYDFPDHGKSLSHVNSACLWGRLNPGCRGYEKAKNFLSIHLEQSVLLSPEMWQMQLNPEPSDTREDRLSDDMGPTT